MNPEVSLETKASLLLTAPLLVGRESAADTLSPGEFRKLARLLRDSGQQLSDLLSSGMEALPAEAWTLNRDRVERLLDRGFLLSQALEHWLARAIWVRSPLDEGYPTILRQRMGDSAPAVLYGCGEQDLLSSGGLAIVGSRNADETLLAFAMDAARLAARAHKAIVSGGARGIDQAAMRGALEAGGTVVGILADSLEKMALKRDHRPSLLDGELVLVSPYDPTAGFNVGNAMQRNKLIYALADAALVVNSDLNKGGTWAGATEQLEKLRFVPVFVRAKGAKSAGLDGLRDRGALDWPEPADPEELETVMSQQPEQHPKQTEFALPASPPREPGTGVGSTGGPSQAQDVVPLKRESPGD